MTFRTISILLCFVMLFVFMPQSILAEAGELLGGDDPEAAIEEQKSEPAYVLGEMIDDRSSNTKTFRMSDGSFVLADYDKPVHFEDADGKWTDYDNTLKYIEDDGFVGYENTASDVLMRFSESISDKWLVSLQSGKYAIGMQLKDAVSGGKTEITNTAEAPEGNDIDSATTLTKYSSGVKYEDILADTDIQYVLNGGNLKENIIVKERTGEYVYTFNLALEGLAAALAEDGSVLLNDDETGEAVFVIPAGYMYDANYECSDNVYYSIEEKDGVLTLTVIADAEWMEDEERAFPVTIDPTFEAASTGLDTLDTYVSQANPSTNYYLSQTMPAGYQNGSANEVLIKAKHLNEIPKSAVVINSYINFRVSSVAAGSRTDGINAIIKAYPVTSSWTSDAATWNNKPSYSGEALDYVAFYSNSSYGDVQYDITRIAREWYSGTANNGIVLKAGDNTDGYVVFYSSDNNVNADYKPKLVIEYRDTKGLDDRWTFAAQSAGSAGGGYVNGFNGNLVFVHNDMNTKGGILPVAVSHVFNAAKANEEFSSAMPVGKGWKLSVQETISSTTIGNTTWYIFNDSDGTDLYFYYDSIAGNYISEDGLGLTLTFGSGDNRYTLTDDYGNKKNFNASGNISSIVDVNGNKKLFKYISGTSKLEKIQFQGAGSNTAADQLTFAYYTNGAIKTITDAVDTDDYVTFKYSSTYNGAYNDSASSGYLRSITYSKGGGCYYAYTSAGNISGAYDNDTDCAVYYSYTAHSYTGVNNATVTTYKVSQVSESGFDNDIIDWPTGQTVRFTYADKKFTARTSGTDDTIGNIDDILTTYIFDNEGREICSYSSDVNDQYVYGTSYNKYTTTEQGSKKNSKITVDSVKGANSFNYVVNGNLESLSGWTSGVSGNGYSSALSSADRFLGTYSMKFASTSGGTGYARRYATVELPSNGTYTLSAYVKIDENFTASSGGGAYIVFDGTESEKFTAKTNTNIQNGWRRISVTKTFSTGGNKTIQLRLANAAGTVYFDCVQVEKGEAPSGFNAVQNGHMDLQNSWSGGSTYEFDNWRLEYTKKVVGNPNAHNYASQTVKLSVPSDTTLMLSGWGKAVSAPTGEDVNNKTRTFRIVANVHYTDGSWDDQPADFNADYTDWQYSAAAIIPGLDDNNNPKAISYIIIYLSYDFNINEAFFSDVCLTVEPAQTYKYDENGHVESAKDALGNTTGATYNNVDLTDLTTPVGLNYEYTYDSKHRLTSATKNSNGSSQTVTYGYDSYGNTTSAVLSSPDISKTISSSASYSSDGNFLASVTDQLGGVTAYSRDNTTKLLSYIQNANGNRTAYVYDNRYRTSKIYNDKDGDGTPDSNEEFVQYLYSSMNRLQSVNTDTSTYTLEYDAFGNVSKIKAGTNTIATYTYGPYNGKLKKLTYGNGYYEEYTYDYLDRIKQVKYNGDSTKTYTLTYSNDGNIYSAADTVAGIKYIYEYDSLGRLIRGEQKKTSDNSTSMSLENRFDEYGRSSGGSYVLGNKTLNYDIEYEDGSDLVSYYTFPDNTVNSYVYDAFDRLTYKKYHNLAYYSAYQYYSPSSAATSSLVSLQYNSYSGGTSKYDYTYDILGNITEIYENNVLKLSYEYDSLGQLVRENNAYANKTWVYTYDLSGNITARKEYAYTTGTLPASYTQKIYSYSAGTWGDLLTAYDGTTITYDAIGNPMNWRNATSLTWDGRKLTNQSISSTNSLSYGYNSDGIRVSKSYGSSSEMLSRSYQYILDGTRIIYEKQQTVAQYGGSTNELYYYYDESGVAGFELDGTKYYYLKNIQGDVINILNSSGQVVVTYTYDAWGKVLSITGTLASSVGQINPFRYRSYYYDRETGFYYLQTRYYDPEVGRFLNADGIIGANGGIQGYNMFAYCNNMPVMASDPSGEWWLSDAWDWVCDKVDKVVDTVAVVVDTVVTFVDNVIEDISKFDFDNTDGDKVFEAHYFSFYKGQLVIRHELPFVTSWAICGTIFLNHDLDDNENRMDDFNHEWGHTQQEKELGLMYIPMVAIPSVGYNIASRFDDDLKENYYNMPWERKADLFGGVNRSGHKPGSEKMANIYHGIGVGLSHLFGLSGPGLW